MEQFYPLIMIQTHLRTYGYQECKSYELMQGIITHHGGPVLPFLFIFLLACDPFVACFSLCIVMNGLTR